MKIVAIACVCAGTLAIVGCDGRGVPTSPSATTAVSAVPATASEGLSLSPALAAAPRSGDLHATKDCGSYQGHVGEFCTIKASNVKAIEPESRVIYLQPLGATALDSDVILDIPGPGNNQAFGHCTVDLGTGLGLCTFSGGTGKFTNFTATVDVTPPGQDGLWHWDGAYSFNPHN